MSDEKRGMMDLNQTSENAAKRRPNHLFLIGVNKYSNGIRPLNNAVQDAISLKEVLHDKYQFSPENTTELFDENASHDNISETLHHLAKTLTDKDNLVLFFAGHGIHDEVYKRGYWIPYGARLGKTNDYVNNTEIIDFLKATEAHHVICIVDSCFSEAIFSTRLAQQEVENRVDELPSRWAISAGRLEPVEDGLPGGNSPFTESLVAYFDRDDINIVWASELSNHIFKIVAYNSGQIPRGESIPDVGHQGGMFLFRKKGYFSKVDPIQAKLPKKPNPIRSISVVPQPNFKKAQEANDLDEWKEIMKLFIAEDLKKSMVSLNAGFDRSSSKYNDLILLRARLNSANTDMKRGLVTSQQNNMVQNQIRYALIELIDDMEEGDLEHFKIQK